MKRVTQTAMCLLFHCFSQSQLGLSQPPAKQQPHNTDTVIHLEVSDTYCAICLEDNHPALIKYPCEHLICAECNNKILSNHRENTDQARRDRTLEDSEDRFFNLLTGREVQQEDKKQLQCPYCRQDVHSSTRLIHKEGSNYCEETSNDSVKSHLAKDRRRRVLETITSMSLGTTQFTLRFATGIYGGAGLIEAICKHRHIYGTCLMATSIASYAAGNYVLKVLSKRCLNQGST
ncbi:MAG: hypothetical protein OXT67_10275 [Zetaproteobacteria bacterium]|nr:hypothetical protein [Zetaproteobacteria bacterium]